MKTITFNDLMLIINRSDLSVKLQIGGWDLYIENKKSFFVIRGDDDCPIYYHALYEDNESIVIDGNRIYIKTIDSKLIGAKKDIPLEVFKITPYLF